MPTEQQTAGTTLTDTGAPAAATMLTADPAATDTTAEQKPVDGQAPATAADAPATNADEPAEEKPQGAPEEYADFTAPEGVTFNAETMTEFKAFAKEKNLSQEDAQKLVDIGMKNAQQRDANYRDQIEQAQKQWAESSRTDKEFGGDKLDENLAVAKQALATFGSPELSAMLEESGLGNHPEIIRAFYRVGKAVSEDRLVKGTTRPAAADDVTKKLYPTMN